MTVGELRGLLDGVPYDMQVLIPGNAAGGFDGSFFSPCNEATGVGSLGLSEDEDDTEDSFVIAPHGFFQEQEGPPPELN